MGFAGKQGPRQKIAWRGVAIGRFSLADQYKENARWHIPRER